MLMSSNLVLYDMTNSCRNLFFFFFGFLTYLIFLLRYQPNNEVFCKNKIYFFLLNHYLKLDEIFLKY